MVISGFQKLTLVDYPGHTACIVFTQGCNFKCPFCHNSDLINFDNNSNRIDEQVLFDYLDKRKGLIDGVCVSGGEPLLQKDIELFIRKIKEKADVLHPLFLYYTIRFTNLDFASSFHSMSTELMVSDRDTDELQIHVLDP